VKVTTEELERCEVLMTVEVEAQREQDILQKAAKKIARQIKIPGFRPGKAPYNVVVRRFGLEAVQQEAFEDSADRLVQDALNEANVQPFAQIQLESVDWSPLIIKVKVPTAPVVELGEYRDIRLEAEPVEVSEEDVDKALQDLQERTATWTPVERPAELGDMVTMSVVEKEGDEVLAQNDSVEYELVPHEHDHEEDEQQRGKQRREQ
jgi:trigger factor